MEFKDTCTECSNNSLEYSMELTLESYIRENLVDISTVLPYHEVPIKPDYVILKCLVPSCGHVERVSISDYILRVRNNLALVARAVARRHIGTPENYEQYFKKYIFEKGLHKKISKLDRENNPYLDKLIKDVEKKYSKNSTS